jgi:GT2 family glycosyltransferase
LNDNPDVDVVTANAWNRGAAFDGQPYWPETAGVRPLSRADILEREDSVCIMTVFRREVATTVGGFDPSLVGSEDYDFWLRAAKAGFRFLQNRQPLGYYRRRPDGLSSSERQFVRILDVLRRARQANHDPHEIAIIDRQIARFELERMAIEAKSALRQGDFRTAAERFRALYTCSGGFSHALLAAASRHTPRLLRWIDERRRSDLAI